MREVDSIKITKNAEALISLLIDKGIITEEELENRKKELAK